MVSVATETTETPDDALFDRAAYELPVLDRDGALALAAALLAVNPAGASPSLDEEAARLRAAHDRAKLADDSEGSARSYDVAMDRAWATFVRRVGDFADLDGARHEGVADAAKAYAIVRDLSILDLNYLAEFAQIGARLDALKREGLFEAARASAGHTFVDEVLRCHGEYGAALDAFGAAARACTEARRALIAELGEYTFQALALARSGRPEGWAQVHQALAPIAALRARRSMAPPPPPPPEHPPVASYT